MKVILFRHGPAEARDPSRWPDDSARPLTPRGEKRTRLAACGLRRFEREIERVITSPFKRAERTARILGRVLEIDPVETLDALAPGGAQRRILEAVNAEKRGDTVVLVGHEPDLGNLAGLLVLGAGVLPLRKAGACAISFEAAARPGTGTLEWLAPPRLLGRVTRTAV